MLILDIGCGQKKLPGSVGIDFSEMSDADVVLDLNNDSLPYKDGQVQYIYTSHCLEHLTEAGFMWIMSEMYRVLRHDGKLFISVPYFTNTLNLANPFHNNNICFNEHTFRFFSSDPEVSCLDESEYATPSCPQWGLRYSANSEIGMEFRMEYIDFSYFPEYDSCSDEVKRLSRRTKLDVVDQISYLLVPVKPSPSNVNTAPIETGDPSQYFRTQMSYLDNQLLRVNPKKVTHKNFSKETCKIIENRKNVREIHEGLFGWGEIVLPVYEAIRRYDSAIQEIARFMSHK